MDLVHLFEGLAREALREASPFAIGGQRENSRPAPK
jgi:hypothetical protein